MRVHFAIVATLCGLALAVASTAAAAGTVGTTFPAGFPVLPDASLGTPVLGFGAAGPVVHTPVIFLHGNNDTPYPTTCSPARGTAGAARATTCDSTPIFSPDTSSGCSADPVQ
jgi:hypothetical protein